MAIKMTDAAGKTVTIAGGGSEEGQIGPQGPKGDNAGFGTPTVTIDNNTGTPSVTVTASGPDTAKVFHFDFKNLKGDKGDPGSNAAGVSSFNGRTGVVTPTNGDYTANQITLNSISGMSSTDVQSAISELFSSGSNGKSQIASAITSRGIQTDATDSFSTMAGNIRKIKPHFLTITFRNQLTADETIEIYNNSTYSYYTLSKNSAFTQSYFPGGLVLFKMPNHVGLNTFGRLKGVEYYIENNTTIVDVSIVKETSELELGNDSIEIIFTTSG